MKKIIIFSLLALGNIHGFKAQNAAVITPNSTPPVVGTNSSGFGWGALNGAASATGNENTGTGYNAMDLISSGNFNTADGKEALYNNDAGNENTASGYRALYNNGCATCGAGGNDNTATGVGAMNDNTTGSNNTANGNNALSSNTTGGNNTADGYRTLVLNNGSDNTAIGSNALQGNTSGSQNTGAGINALYENALGSNNTALGENALYSNGTYGTNYGDDNTAIGSNALYNNFTGLRNTAIGVEALKLSTSGYDNVAIGYRSSYNNTTGSDNVTLGNYAGYSNTTGSGIVAVGYRSLYYNTGDANTAVGDSAGMNNSTGTYNTIIGNAAMVYSSPGSYNTLLGAWTDVTGTYTNQTVIGYKSLGLSGDDKIMLGDGGVTVETQFNYSVVSDKRFKNNITEGVKGLEFIKRLRPVAYNLDTKKLMEFRTKNLSEDLRKRYAGTDYTDASAVRQSGFIAQEVEKAAAEVAYDFNGLHKPDTDDDHYSLAYSMFVVPLVKAVQEQQDMIVQQKQRTNDLQKALDEQMQQVKVLSTGAAKATGVNNLSASENDFSMSAQPNPFSQETIIKFNLPGFKNNAYLSVCDLSGTQLVSLPITVKGNSSLTLTSEKLAAGMYIYSIIADGKVMGSKRLIVSGK